MTCFAPEIALFNTFAVTVRSSQGVSHEALKIAESERLMEQNFMRPVSLFAKYRQGLESLREAAASAQHDNWDDEGARSVHEGALHHASRFLAVLPESYRTSEISVDPDGEMSFEWYEEPHIVFSVSVGPTGMLTYAGHFGNSTIHGREDFFFARVPDAILAGIRRIISARVRKRARVFATQTRSIPNK